MHLIEEPFLGIESTKWIRDPTVSQVFHQINKIYNVEKHFMNGTEFPIQTQERLLHFPGHNSNIVQDSLNASLVNSRRNSLPQPQQQIISSSDTAISENSGTLFTSRINFADLSGTLV